MATVLISGGAGFIGSHLARRCLERGNEVHIVTRAATDLWRISDIADRVTIHRTDLTCGTELDALFDISRPAQVFHLGVSGRARLPCPAEDALLRIKQDQVALGELVAAMDRAAVPPEVFIRCGSLAEYGPISAPFHETDREQPTTAYAASLVSGTHYLDSLRTRLKFRVATARLALVFGPTQNEDFFIPSVVRQCIAGEPITVRRPDDVRDLLYVDDAVDGLLAIAECAPSDVTLFNVSTGGGHRVADIAELICATTASSKELIRVEPEDLERDGNLAIENFVGCPDRCAELVNWTAKIGLRDGLRRLTSWNQDQLQKAADGVLT